MSGCLPTWKTENFNLTGNVRELPWKWQTLPEIANGGLLCHPNFWAAVRDHIFFDVSLDEWHVNVKRGRKEELGIKEDQGDPLIILQFEFGEFCEEQNTIPHKWHASIWAAAHTQFLWSLLLQNALILLGLHSLCADLCRQGLSSRHGKSDDGQWHRPAYFVPQAMVKPRKSVCTKSL